MAGAVGLEPTSNRFKGDDNNHYTTPQQMVLATGLEPVTSSMSTTRSNQLS